MSDRPASLIPLELVSPGVDDPRQRALVQAFGEMLAEIDLGALISTDPMTADAQLLPYLILEHAAGQFIDPDLPEEVQRRILARIWDLKALHGYDAGVALGLELLGMRGDIVQWWMAEPKGPPDTHEITFTVGEALFDEEAILGPRIIAAAHRMIKATKRFSQESQIRIRVEQKSALSVSTAARSVEVQRPKGVAARPTDFANDVDTSAHARAVHILRFDGEAA